jgi:CheY-like chemotaxis protein
MPCAVPLRILVVDRDHAASEATAGVLSRKGHSVERARSRGHALQKIVQMRPHLVVVDLTAAGTDGIATAKAIRSMKLSPPPFLAALASPLRADARRDYIEAGFEHVLHKPVPPSMLDQFIELARHNLALGARVASSKGWFDEIFARFSDNQLEFFRLALHHLSLLSPTEREQPLRRLKKMVSRAAFLSSAQQGMSFAQKRRMFIELDRTRAALEGFED